MSMAGGHVPPCSPKSPALPEPSRSPALTDTGRRGGKAPFGTGAMPPRSQLCCNPPAQRSADRRVLLLSLAGYSPLIRCSRNGELVLCHEGLGTPERCRSTRAPELAERGLRTRQGSRPRSYWRILLGLGSWFHGL